MLLTLAVPDWIEVLFGIEPDGGSGEAEWMIVLALAGAAVLAAGLSFQTWRRVVHDSPSS
jgi:hypothetical protein